MDTSFFKPPLSIKINGNFIIYQWRFVQTNRRTIHCQHVNISPGIFHRKNGSFRWGFGNRKMIRLDGKKPNEQHRLRCSCRHLSICFAGGFYHKNPMCQCHLDIRNQIRGIHGSPWLFAEFWAPNGGGDITNSNGPENNVLMKTIIHICVYIYMYQVHT